MQVQVKHVKCVPVVLCDVGIRATHHDMCNIRSSRIGDGPRDAWSCRVADVDHRNPCSHGHVGVRAAQSYAVGPIQVDCIYQAMHDVWRGRFAHVHHSNGVRVLSRHVDVRAAHRHRYCLIHKGRRGAAPDGRSCRITHVHNEKGARRRRRHIGVRSIQTNCMRGIGAHRCGAHDAHRGRVADVHHHKIPRADADVGKGVSHSEDTHPPTHDKVTNHAQRGRIAHVHHGKQVVAKDSTHVGIRANYSHHLRTGHV